MSTLIEKIIIALALPLLFVQLSGCATSVSKLGFFCTKVEDGLGRPVRDVSVRFLFFSDSVEGQQEVMVDHTNTGQFGIGCGSWARRQVPEDKEIHVELIKEGYSNFTEMGVFYQSTLLRQVSAKELAALRTLTGAALTHALRESLGGIFKGDPLASFAIEMFPMAARIRHPLKSLLTDKHVREKAISLLTAYGYPEDIRYILVTQSAFTLRRDNVDWRYKVAASLLSPTTDLEWEFLEKCVVLGEKKDWPFEQCFQSLRLIGNERAFDIIKQAKSNDDWREKEINKALSYLATNPSPYEDPSLEVLALRLSKELFYKPHPGPYDIRFDDSKNLALIFLSPEDGHSSHSVIFHRMGNKWVLRGFGPAWAS